MSTQLLDIAYQWSAWDRPFKASVARTVPLPVALHPGIALVVQGVRRCGKSTLMEQLVGRYGLAPATCLFINFEDPRLIDRLEFSVLDELQAAFEARHTSGTPLTFFFDEVQNVRGWERWLRTQLDRGTHRFVISGSNAHLLSGELGTVLTGRHLTVELQPFSWEEARRLDPTTTLEQHIVRGGFPAPLQVGPDADKLLQTYFSDIVTRDVRERVGARSSRPVLQVAKMCFESAGSELSYRRVAAAAGISVDTAKDYLNACATAYLVYQCPFFAWSERKRASRSAKYYPVDTGLRRTVVTRGGADRGKGLECATFLALKRRFEHVYYWRGGRPGEGEVDFVVQHNGRLVPLQVTWESEQPRHARALEQFYERFPMADDPVLVTAETFDDLRFMWPE